MVFAETFLTTMLLPFLLVFVVIFAILEKSKVFGNDKHQINSLVSLLIGLILITFPGPRDIIIEFMPWLAVGVAALLLFMILFGFVYGDLSNGLPGKLKTGIGILVGIFVIGVILSVTNLYDKMSSWFGNIGESSFLNFFFLIIVIGLIVWVILSSKRQNNNTTQK